MIPLDITLINVHLQIEKKHFSFQKGVKIIGLVPAASFQGKRYSTESTLPASFLHAFLATIGRLPAPFSL